MNIDYTEISETYDKHRSYSKDLIETIIEFGSIKKDMKVLELGCGTGNAIVGLRENLQVDSIGVDKSRRMLRRACKKDLKVVCADIDSQYLPFCDGSVDIVLLVYVIHQITKFNNHVLTIIFIERFALEDHLLHNFKELSTFSIESNTGSKETFNVCTLFI